MSRERHVILARHVKTHRIAPAHGAAWYTTHILLIGLTLHQVLFMLLNASGLSCLPAQTGMQHTHPSPV